MSQILTQTALRQMMTAVILITIACLVLSTRAKTCLYNQHCSECSTPHGDCITECYPGYFGSKCKSVCSRNCKQRKCKLLESVGIGKCTEGCEPGYRGENCKLNCLVLTENCTICPGGCEGHYCNQGDTCFSGCKDNYFGSDCKACSSRCESCNRITGTCNHCHPPYHGQNCEYTCHNCSGSCEDGCTRVCPRGIYGNLCAEHCSENCRSDPAINSEEQCLERDVNISNVCIPECHQESGECIHGCVAGWYGPKCSSPCNSNCIDKRCDDTGGCAEGCTLGHLGKQCKPCSEICANYTCDSKSGSCLNACSNGTYGKYCNLTSYPCIDDVCDQKTGKCINGCFIAKDGCKHYCSMDVPTTVCTTGSCVTETPRASSINLSSVALVVVMLVAVAVCYICYRKGRSSTRNNQVDEVIHSAVTEQAVTGEYQGLHRYWEIREADMNTECEPSNNQEIGEMVATETYTTIGARYISPIDDDKPYSE